MKKLKQMIMVLTIFLLFPLTAQGKEQTYLDYKIVESCLRYGEEYNICPELLIAIIEAESRGEQYAENGSCKGLMQVSVRWHKDRMNKLGVTDIYDIDGNIHVGTDFLAELFDTYEDVGAVLMFYNGDSRLDSYLKGECDLSGYARKILARSEQLEIEHGKVEDMEKITMTEDEARKCLDAIDTVEQLRKRMTREMEQFIDKLKRDPLHIGHVLTAQTRLSDVMILLGMNKELENALKEQAKVENGYGKEI